MSILTRTTFGGQMSYHSDSREKDIRGGTGAVSAQGKKRKRKGDPSRGRGGGVSQELEVWTKDQGGTDTI